MIGIQIKDNALYFNGVEIAGDNKKGEGLHVKPPRDLYFSRQYLTTGDEKNKKGLYVRGEDLLFDGVVLGQDSGVNPDEFTPKGFWIAPMQDDGSHMRNWTYQQWIDAYDELVAIEPRLTKHRYEDSSGNPIMNPLAPYELFHYKFEPENYTKTIYIQAQIHGNEKDSRLTLFRMIEALIKKRGRYGYTAWQDIYNNCRLIFIPVVSPWGNDNSNARTPYREDLLVNANRTSDFIHSPSNESGSGGSVPFDIPETQHMRDVLKHYGYENIDYAIDYHDGAGVAEHYWIGYNLDAGNREPTLSFIHEMLERRGIPLADAKIGHTSDSSTAGTSGAYFSKTLGIAGATNEWLPSFFGGDFSSEHLTHSMEVRANTLFMGYKYDFKSWKINEAENAQYFHFDYPKALTRQTMRPDGPYQSLYVTQPQIIQRWEDFSSANPSKISKSISYGTNKDGLPIHSYTFGSGTKKVLFLGGCMRTGVDNRIDEYAVYLLLEYLLNDYIVNQSKFLQDLRDNYTITVLPFISTKQGINDLDDANRVIAKSVINDNTDASVIYAGGESVEGVYPDDYHVQVVTPVNQVFSMQDYTNHLESDRNETTSIEKTDGSTILDYAYDAYNINGYYVNQKVSSRFVDLQDYHNMDEVLFLHSNYETGRRLANLVNFFIKG